MVHKMSLVQVSALAAWVLIAPLAYAPSAGAQPSSARPQGEAGDPIAQRVFPPDLVMGHADEIGLTPRQRERIIAEVKVLQSRVSQLAPGLERARAHMVAELDGEPADEAHVVGALDSVLAAEREVKRANIATLVRIRNVLTASQRARLNAVR